MNPIPPVFASFRRFPAAIGTLLLSFSSAFSPVVLGADAPDELKQGDSLELTSSQASQAVYQRSVAPFLQRHCQRCHGDKSPEAELDLPRLDPDMSTTSAARWALVLENLVEGKMPPAEEARPAQAEVAAVVAWIRAELKRTGKHLQKREAYANGNQVPHGQLFGVEQAAPFDAPGRVRRLSPPIYESFTNKVGKNARGIGQPFSPPGGTTFADMGAPKVDEPITVQLFRNALAIVDHQTSTRMDKDQRKWTGVREFEPLFDPRRDLDDDLVATAIQWQFDRVLRRPPTDKELSKFTDLLHRNVRDAGRETGIRYTLAAVFLLPDAVFRWEVGQGPADERGRLRLGAREIAFALAYALTDEPPPKWLLEAADAGKLDSRAGVEAAVRRMLEDPSLDKPRIIRFFREYFQYPDALEVFKQREDFPEHDPRILVQDTDQLILHVLERDRDVLRELLTTNKSFVNYRYDPKKKTGVPARDDLRHLSYNLPPDWKWTANQPIELPSNQRAGILTQPAWLVAMSKSDENHAIIRGKWVRERLLGGVVPDIPITVDAQLPHAPDKTLRERMAVTQQQYCWQCHKLMNRVGLPFEMYDHFGRFRTQELGKPVNATGGFEFTDDPRLEGETRDALEFVKKMAESQYVEQVFVRHAFRYWMGRNETPGDAPSLQAAHQAYRTHHGSMRELIVALLTSESFLYRVPSTPERGEGAD